MKDLADQPFVKLRMNVVDLKTAGRAERCRLCFREVRLFDQTAGQIERSPDMNPSEGICGVKA